MGVSEARVTLRVAPTIWEADDRRAELIDILSDYRDTIDELALFTSMTHPPLPLSVIESRSRHLKSVMPELREVVPLVGINHLSTLGHLNENLPNSLSEPWQRLTGVGGETVAGRFCPSDPDMQDYIRKCYIALAGSKPDYIWIDDDLRLEGFNLAPHTCFCSRCLAKFSEETGRQWTREALGEALNGGLLADRIALRKQWLEHNRGTLLGVARLIRDAVDSVDPKLVLGQMSGEIFYSGIAFGEWGNILAGKNEVPVKWRPGGGQYADRDLCGMINKAHGIGRQIAMIGPEVMDIQSEIENFPNQILMKSPTSTLTESAIYIGAGCTGTALNFLGVWRNHLEEHLPIFEKAMEFRPFLDAAAQSFGRSDCEGVWAAYNKDSFAAVKAESKWHEAVWGAGLEFAQDISEIGIPTAYSRSGSSVALLKSDSCLAFTRNELIDLLSGAVLMDAPALIRLNDMGFGEYTGWDIADVRPVDNMERLTDDPLNGRFAGWARDTRPSFWAENTYVLKPTHESSRAVSEVIDFTDTIYGTCMGVSENRFGGRVAVSGYSPWSLLQSLPKTSQLKSVLRWLSQDTLPAYVASHHKTSLWCRKDARGRRTMMLLNAYLDPAIDMQLAVLGDIETLEITHVDGLRHGLAKEMSDGPYSVFELPEIGPWEVVLLREL